MLQRIELDKFQDKVEWLWERVRTQNYAFDDTVKDNSQAFLLTLFRPDSVHWYCDEGMVSVTNIQPEINANIHFLMWDHSYPVAKIIAEGKKVIEQVFVEFDLARVTATVPHFSSNVMRLAVALGMKYEGTMRECFLHEGKFYDLVIYGMLRREFEKEKTNGRTN